jgi:SpoVK/Ycf46/Vps4 family AAA+-type ATPase
MSLLQQYSTPILSKELEDRIGDAIQHFLNRGLWREWGLDKIREQGAAILLHGAPGLGKTITAYYIAKKLHLRVAEVSMADYGSHVPGELARTIKKIFNGELILARQEKRQPPLILLDEADAMLVSRKKLGAEMIWMLEPINELLAQISKYPGLVVLATNMAAILDDALERRLIAKIRFDRPTEELRRKIWKEKWPDKFPCQPNNGDLDQLAEFDLTGAQIENIFLLWSGRVMRERRVAMTSDLIKFIGEDWTDYFQS